MGEYAGRYTQDIESHNFGGIDRSASVVNIRENSAEDITNWDINLDGSISRRKGYTLQANVGDHATPYTLFYYPFQDTTGVFRHAAVAYNASNQLCLYDAASPAGPWTLRGTNLFTVTDASKYIGVSWKGGLYIFNGTDKPIYHTYQGTAKTLEEASQLANNTVCSFVRTGAFGGSATVRGYAVSATTPRGKTIPAVVLVDSGSGNYYNIETASNFVAGSGYMTITWDPVVDAYGYEIYMTYVAGTRFSGTPAPATGAWVRLAVVSAATTTYVDTGIAIDLTPGVVNFANTVNNAYNTPNDWNLNGQPQGAVVVAKGLTERLLAWRNGQVWGCALSNGRDWFEAGDAFTFSLAGGLNTFIKGAASLFEYTVLFSSTDAYVYTGATVNDMSLQKIIPVGCVAHNSIVRIGTDLALWSQYGPTTFKRILSGADIAASTGFNDPIKQIIFEETNQSQWNRIHGYTDISKNRVVWACPATSGTTNTMAIVYQYDMKGFTKYDSWPFIHSYAIPGTTEIYSAKDPANSSGGVYRVSYGNLDIAAAITATYSSCFFDWGTYIIRKRMVRCDILASRDDGNYTFDFGWNWDFGQMTGTAITCTQATTDGNPIETTSSTTTQHQCYTDGIGNAVQLTFTSSAGDQTVKILGWRPETRGRGIRP